MTAKEYLQQFKIMNEKIDAAIERYEFLKSRASGSRGIDYSKEHVQTSPVDQMCETVCDFVDLNEKINEMIDKYVDEKEIAISRIAKLEDTYERQVLICIYLDFKGVRETMKQLCIGYDRLRTAEKTGLRHLEDKFSTDLYTIC